MMRKLWPLLVLLATACLQDTSAAPTSTVSTVTSVVLSPASASMAIGQTMQFNANITGQTATTQITWSVSDTSVARISATGLLTAKGSGTAVVKVTADTLSATVSLTVSPSAISLTPGSATLVVGGATQFSAVVNDGTGRPSVVTWSFSDPAVASVSNTGYVSAKGTGAGVVTAAVGNITASANVSVTPSGLAVNVGSGVFTVGQTVQFNATVGDGTGVQSAVTWSFSDPNVGALSPYGSFTARGTGTGVVTVRTGGLTATATISVLPGGLTLTPGAPSLSVGQTVQMHATVLDGTGTPSTVTWSFSDAPVGSVTSAGLFSATGTGSGTITARAGGFTATASVTVAPSGIVVTPGTATVAVGSGVQLTATVGDGTGGPSVVSWSFSDASVGAVSASGFFTARGSGAGIATATAGALSATTAVVVTPSGVNVSPASVTIEAGQAQEFQASVNDGTGRTSTVAWSVVDPSVAAVNGAGLVTGLAPGTTTLRAIAGGVTASATVTVTAGTLDRISACQRDGSGCSTFNLPALGNATTVRAFAYNTRGADISSTCTFTWSAANAGILTIEPIGTTARDALITRVLDGTVTVSVRCGQVTGLFTVF